MGRRQARIETDRAAGQVTGFGPAAHGHLEAGAKGERLRLGQRASRPGALLDLHASHPAPVAKGQPPHVGLELPVQEADVPEGLAARLARGPPGLEQGREAVDLAAALVGTQHEVVHERPGLRVEDRGPVLLRIGGRALRHREEVGQGLERAPPQRLEVIGHGPSLVDAVLFDDRVPPELREPFVQPDGQRVEVQAEDEVDVLVEDHQVGVVPGVVVLAEPRHVDAQRDPVPVGSAYEDAGGMERSVLLPESGEEGTEASLVSHGQNGHGPAGVDARPRPHLPEECTHLLELQDHPARVLLAPVRDHGEGRASDLHPRLGVPRKGHTRHSCQQGDGRTDPRLSRMCFPRARRRL